MDDINFTEYLDFIRDNGVSINDEQAKMFDRIKAVKDKGIQQARDKKKAQQLKAATEKQIKLGSIEEEGEGLLSPERTSMSDESEQKYPTLQ